MQEIAPLTAYWVYANEAIAVRCRGRLLDSTTIVLAPGIQPSEELVHELQEHVKSITAAYKYPRIIEFVEELPKTISGKIRRAEIRARQYAQAALVRRQDQHRHDRPGVASAEPAGRDPSGGAHDLHRSRS